MNDDVAALSAEHYCPFCYADIQAILDRFLDQQVSMFEMMLPMMESMRESLETNP